MRPEEKIQLAFSDSFLGILANFGTGVWKFYAWPSKSIKKIIKTLQTLFWVLGA